MNFLETLAARRRFGMKPRLGVISDLCACLGNPQRDLRAIHIAGTNGKGATAATISAALHACGFKVARYTSPHLVSLNERFFIGEKPVADSLLESAASRVAAVASDDFTFFEALTAVAFLLFAEAKVDYAVLETGLGGRYDATNICSPVLSVLTRIGLDHCDWLGNTIGKIANEKAGIIKPRVKVVTGPNVQEAMAVFAETAMRLDAPLLRAEDLANEADIPSNFSLSGSFNRENAVTAIAALKAIGLWNPRAAAGLSHVVWPGRYHKVGNFIIDGAHNPPAARALAAALNSDGAEHGEYILVAGFCADKNVAETLKVLKPFVRRAYAVKTSNPRSLDAQALAETMHSCGIVAEPAQSLSDALRKVGNAKALVCGSLFLAGEALVELGAYPWPQRRAIDPAELLKPQA